MRVIYIAGAAHSGSTLLDLMLNAHPEIVSVGEVLKLNRQLGYRDPERKNYAPCSCGAPSLLQCKFWSAVDAETRATTGKPLTELDVLDGDTRDPRHAPNVTLFKAIAAVSGKKFIVDSSKIPRRLSQLMQFPELGIYPVHLVRDPKGQIASVMRKHSGFLKNIVRYEIVQEQIHRKLKSVPHSVVRYEDLVRDPERSLNSILQPLGLSFDRRQLSWAEADKHIVAGNHMRYDTTSSLVLDEKWRERLTASQQRIIDLGTTRSRRLLPPTGFIVGD
jgi:Sulfotransferase family